MKKQTAMFWSISALLTISAVAPHVLWQTKKETHRSPSSIDQKDQISDKLKELEVVDVKSHGPVAAVVAEAPLKDLEHKEVAIASREVKKVEVEAQISCVKDKQPKDLEAEVKKLMEDKEKIMKELEELKAASKKEDKKDDKKKVAKTDYNEDILGIMSQLSSLMVSQQQQQMQMMNQMFSMFQTQQPKQQSWYSPLSDYMSPYAFHASQFDFPGYSSPYSMEGIGSRVGLGYPSSSTHGGFPEYFSRTPAQQSDFGPMFERSQFNDADSFQPQTVRPHNGFNFSQGTDAMTMQRMQF